ncbi:hypothetical protein B0H13DRAFT_1936492, partial [Mycena leptocephala]
MPRARKARALMPRVHIGAPDSACTSAGAQSQNYRNSKEAKRTYKSKRHVNRDWVPARSRKSANPRLGRQKPEGNSPTPAKPEVRRTGLERGGGGMVESVYSGLKDGVSTPNIYRKFMELVSKINRAGRKKKVKEEGGRDGERESKGRRSMEEGETREGRGRKEWEGREGGGNEVHATRCITCGAATDRNEASTHYPPNPHHREIHHRIPLLSKPRHLPHLPYPTSVLASGQREVSRAFQVELHRLYELGAHHGCGEALRGRRGVREEEERDEWGCPLREEREEEVRGDSEEWGEQHGSAEAGVDDPAEPDAHIRDFGIEGSGRRT